MGVRLGCWIAAMCLLSSTGSAQTGLRSASLPDRTPTAPMPPSAPLRSGSLPDRTPTQPIPPTATDVFLATPDTYAPDFGRPRRHHPHAYPVVYAPFLMGAPDPRDARHELPNGYLHLQMQPGTAQVFVDGFYMGSVDEFRRVIPGRSLLAGAHRVEVRAPGYAPTTFDVIIPENETVTYRADLEPSAGAKVVTLPPAVPKTFYVIPGCYAGDKPPRGKLPRGCDPSKVRTIPPQSLLNVKR